MGWPVGGEAGGTHMLTVLCLLFSSGASFFPRSGEACFHVSLQGTKGDKREIKNCCARVGVGTGKGCQGEEANERVGLGWWRGL